MMYRRHLLASTALRMPAERANPPADDAADDELLDDVDGAEGDPPVDDDGDEPADAPDDADEPADEPDGAVAPARAAPEREERPGRASTRFQTLSNENKELKRRLDDMEQRSRAPAASVVPQAPPGLTPAQEAELLATMTAEERIDFKLNKVLNATQQQTQAAMRGMQDTSDKQEFNTLVATTPLLARYQNDVEQHYTRVRNEGGYVPRRAVLMMLLGEKALGRITSGKVKPSPARERVERQRVRAANTRDDVAAPRRSGGRTLEERLEGQPI